MTGVASPGVRLGPHARWPSSRFGRRRGETGGTGAVERGGTGWPLWDGLELLFSIETRILLENIMENWIYRIYRGCIVRFMDNIMKYSGFGEILWDDIMDVDWMSWD